LYAFAVNLNLNLTHKSINTIQDERVELLFCHYVNGNPSNKVEFSQTAMEKSAPPRRC
jgi:hypothetical protein